MVTDQDQQTKLGQLRAITNVDNGEADVLVLESVDWDVQRAVEMFFEETRLAPSRKRPAESNEPTGRGIEQFQFDDSSQTSPPSTSNSGSSALSVLSLPWTLTLNLLSYILRLLRIPTPRLFVRPLNLNWNAFASLWRAGKREPPGVVAERWVRALEDEVGGLTWARMRAAGMRPEAVKEVPDFYLGSYGDVLNAAKRELRILCVVLVSDEHEDVPRFKQQTLTDAEFNKKLRDENILVWGGDVRDVEPYSAGLKLNATTYPFVAFIALHPTRYRALNAGQGTPQNVLSVLSRHAGAARTTPQALIQHLQDKLLPHIRPVFEKYRLEEQTREADRREREESEQRAKRAELRDAERIRKLREERQRKEREAEAEMIQLQILENEKERRSLKLAARKACWRQAGASLKEPIAPNTRITVRLPNGRRVLRQFNDSDRVGDIYAFVASQLASSLPEEEERAPFLAHYDVSQDGWGFLLVTSYPRVPIPWTAGLESRISSIGDGALKNGAMLVVEMEAEDINTSSNRVLATADVGDDEYMSEED